MAPRNNAETLKQQPLSFASRRSTAASNAKSKGSKSPATVPSTPVPITLKSTDAGMVEGGEAEVEGASSVPQKRRSTRISKAVADADEANAAAKKRKLEDVEKPTSAKGKAKGKGKTNSTRGKAVFKSRASIENTGEVSARREQDSSDIELETLAADDTDDSPRAKKRRMAQQYALAREKMDYLALIHTTNEPKEHTILRVFDLSYEYGPCIGMTRLQRWERASELGLNPPLAVKDILLAQGEAMSACVFEGEV